MRITPGQIVADEGEHIVLTGPITGTVTTRDGQTFDVTQEATVVPIEKAEEVAHLVGLRYDAEGHPAHTDEVPFVYEPPKKFKRYKPHSDNPDSIAPSQEG